MATETIVLKGRGIREEGVAADTITPGDLIERTANPDEVQRHSTAAANAAKMVAVENEVVGNGIDVDYAAGDNVLFENVQSGQVVFGLVAAGASAITRGDYLESAGDGTLRLVSSNTATSASQRAGVIAQAREAVDNSGGADKVRIRAVIL